MRRRDFLAAAGAAGYALAVRVDGLSSTADAASTVTRQIPAASLPSFDRVAPPNHQATAGTHGQLARVNLECDVFVAGGGMAGVCAAVAAARHGARVVLVQDRSRLGGNSSSEVKMHIVGANCHGQRPGWREGGLIEEFRLDDSAQNSQRCWELWDLLLYDKVVSEPNITLLLDSTLCTAVVRDNQIAEVTVRCDKSEHLYRIRAGIFCDCTGDARLALEAGAPLLVGRESRERFGESLARAEADKRTLGSTILFTSRDCGRPMPFVPPAWARKITAEQLRFRRINSWEYGYWWIEWGGELSTISDNERIRFELLSIVLGVWDYIKNSGAHPTSANWAMDWMGMLPGRRESRRIEGDHILTQDDLLGINGEFADAVCIGGWPLDDHPPGGFDDSDKPPTVMVKLAEVYGIPLRSLYSKQITNLMMAGRTLSASHVAFTSARVMATCSVMGQAVGTAAAMCAREKILPRELVNDATRIAVLRQSLLKDDQTIKNLANEDALDLARGAELRASGISPGRPAAILDGQVRNTPGQTDHCWAVPLAADGAWLELSWREPKPLRSVQITFDSGFERELTLSSSVSSNQMILRGPQPETVREYVLSVRVPGETRWREITRVAGNHQRLRRHKLDGTAITALRIHVLATNGDKLARIFEVRCYA